MYRAFPDCYVLRGKYSYVALVVESLSTRGGKSEL